MFFCSSLYSDDSLPSTSNKKDRTSTPITSSSSQQFQDYQGPIEEIRYEECELMLESGVNAFKKNVKVIKVPILALFRSIQNGNVVCKYWYQRSNNDADLIHHVATRHAKIYNKQIKQ